MTRFCAPLLTVPTNPSCHARPHPHDNPNQPTRQSQPPQSTTPPRPTRHDDPTLALNDPHDASRRGSPDRPYYPGPAQPTTQAVSPRSPRRAGLAMPIPATGPRCHAATHVDDPFQPTPCDHSSRRRSSRRHCSPARLTLHQRSRRAITNTGPALLTRQPAPGGPTRLPHVHPPASCHPYRLPVHTPYQPDSPLQPPSDMPALAAPTPATCQDQAPRPPCCARQPDMPFPDEPSRPDLPSPVAASHPTCQLRPYSPHCAPTDRTQPAPLTDRTQPVRPTRLLLTNPVPPDIPGPY